MSQHTFREISTEIYGQHLQVRLNGRCLFSLNRPMVDRYLLTLEKDTGQHTIWMRQFSLGSTRLYTSDNPELVTSIMDSVSDALNSMARTANDPLAPSGRKSGQCKWFIAASLVITGAALLLAYVLSHSSPSALIQHNPAPIAEPQQPRMPAPEPLPDEGTEARLLLASRLRNAALKKEYTISLSSGHTRTLYLFADPNCINCRIFEPTIQALSAHFNVEIFPVTLAGKTRTASQVVPLLCAPAEERGNMWRNLFEVENNILDPDMQSRPTLTACEAGQAALARNDQAFEIYRLPGTPTVIADDGRMVPLSAMTGITALQRFLNSSK